MSTSRPQSKPAPQRTCLACRQVKVKGELLRVVRTEAGEIEIDATGKKPGRGAYLCRAHTCWETGLERKRLEHSLHLGVKLDNREQLLEEAKALLKGDQW